MVKERSPLEALLERVSTVEERVAVSADKAASWLVKAVEKAARVDLRATFSWVRL